MGKHWGMKGFGDLGLRVQLLLYPPLFTLYSLYSTSVRVCIVITLGKGSREWVCYPYLQWSAPQALLQADYSHPSHQTSAVVTK